MHDILHIVGARQLYPVGRESVTAEEGSAGGGGCTPAHTKWADCTEYEHISPVLEVRYWLRDKGLPLSKRYLSSPTVSFLLSKLIPLNRFS